MATSVSPSRQGLPKVSVMITGMERFRAFLKLKMDFSGGAVGVFGEEESVAAAVYVGDVDGAVGADQAVSSFGNQDAAFAPDDAAALQRWPVR